MDVKKLISWSKGNYSNLPWRENRSIYSTWISEVMLQQTTVYTVKKRLTLFINKFPSIKSLGNSTEEELLEAWKGLGYYQRAKNLKKAAKYIDAELGGRFPESIEGLQQIPGVGPYTSSAILSIGMDKKALAVDANLERVLARYYGIEIEKGVKLKKEIDELFQAKKILRNSIESWRDLNESLMDLGREICQARKADCIICPIKNGCKARVSGEPLSIPFVSPKTKKEKHELDLLRLVSFKKNKIAVVKKKKGEWLSGQYELPTYQIRTTDSSLSQYPIYNLPLESDLPFLKTGITKYKIKNFYLEKGEKYLKDCSNFSEIEFIDFEVAEKKLSTASLKVLSQVLN